MWRRARRIAHSLDLAWLEARYAQPAAQRNFGVALDVDRVLPPRYLADVAPHVLRRAKGRNTVLYPALFRVWPSWQWGVQGTGDCVSWGTAHMIDVLLSVTTLAGKTRKPDALVASEAIYGFGKAELYNSYRYNGAGMMGYDAVEACKRYGTLYRLVYPGGHDLTRYSGARAVAWGERPSATRGVPDVLEPLAAEHKAVDYVCVRSWQEAAALIEAGYPIQYCGYTYWATRRNQDGSGARFASGWHCMTITGVMYDSDGVPTWWWIANTGHGDHVDGPVGDWNAPSVYAECGGPVPNRLVQPVLAAGDCYSISLIDGWPILDLSELGAAGVLG